MTDLFVPYQESLELKDLGFNEPCFIYWVYDGIEITYSTSHNKSGWSMIGFKNSQMSKKAGLCTTPTLSQAFKFFREKYKLHSRVDIQDVELDWYDYEILEVREGDYNNDLHKDTNFKSYEEAELACLRKLIELAKKEQL